MIEHAFSHHDNSEWKRKSEPVPQEQDRASLLKMAREMSLFDILRLKEDELGDREKLFVLVEAAKSSGLFMEANKPSPIREELMKNYSAYRLYAKEHGHGTEEEISIDMLNQYNQDMFTQKWISAFSHLSSEQRKDTVISDIGSIEKKLTQEKTSHVERQRMLEMLVNNELKIFKAEGKEENMGIEDYLNHYYRDFKITFTFGKTNATTEQTEELKAYREKKYTDRGLLQSLVNHDAPEELEQGIEQNIMCITMTDRKGKESTLPIYTVLQPNSFYSRRSSSSEPFINMDLQYMSHGKGPANIYQVLFHEIDHAVLWNVNEFNDPMLHEGYAVKAEKEFAFQNGLKFNFLNRVVQFMSHLGYSDVFKHDPSVYRYIFALIVVETAYEQNHRIKKLGTNHPQELEYELELYDGTLYAPYIKSVFRTLSKDVVIDFNELFHELKS